MTFGQLQARLTARPLRWALLLATAPAAVLVLTLVTVVLAFHGSGLAQHPELATDGLHGPDTLSGRWQPLIVVGTATVLLAVPVLLLVVLLTLALALVLVTHPRSKRRSWTVLLPLLSCALVAVAASVDPVSSASAWLLD